MTALLAFAGIHPIVFILALLIIGGMVRGVAYGLGGWKNDSDVW